MSCNGLHCAGCGGGSVAPVVILAAVFGADWIVTHVIEVAAVSAACGVLSVAAVVWLMRWADRRDARQMARGPLLHVRAEALPPREAPQVSRGTLPAIEQHVHYHYHGADSQDLARAVTGEVLP